MKRSIKEIKVININKDGRVFDPATYQVPYEGNEHIYAALKRIQKEVMKNA